MNFNLTEPKILKQHSLPTPTLLSLSCSPPFLLWASILGKPYFPEVIAFSLSQGSSLFQEGALIKPAWPMCLLLNQTKSLGYSTWPAWFVTLGKVKP